MKNITYTERNGIRYPNLELPEQTNYPLGKYANLRLDFMKKHKKGRYTTLLTEGRINEYLHAIDIQVHELLDDIIPRLAQERGIDEVLKAHDALKGIYTYTLKFAFYFSTHAKYTKTHQFDHCCKND